VADAALGSTLTVRTVAGEAAVKLPAGTQPGAAVRLRRKGLPRFREKGRGDLFVRVRIQEPERLSRGGEGALQALALAHPKVGPNQKRCPQSMTHESMLLGSLLSIRIALHSFMRGVGCKSRLPKKAPAMRSSSQRSGDEPLYREGLASILHECRRNAHGTSLRLP
jgi:DnaJ-like protein